MGYYGNDSHKGHVASNPKITLSEGSQLLCHEDAQAAFWRGSHDEKLRPPASGRYQLARHVSAPSWK